jgi:hypothetical protein
MLTDDRYWRDRATYSIEEAALLTMGLDPNIHNLRYDSEPEYVEYFHDHPEGFGRFESICICLIDAAENGDIEHVRIIRDNNGRCNCAQTRVLRNSMVEWWKLHGYGEAAAKYGTKFRKIQPVKNSVAPSVEEPVINQSVPQSSLHVRGKRWDDADLLAILKEYEGGNKQQALALKYGVKPQRISALLKNARKLRAETTRQIGFNPIEAWGNSKT